MTRTLETSVESVTTKRLLVINTSNFIRDRIRSRHLNYFFSLTDMSYSITHNINLESKRPLRIFGSTTDTE